VGLDLQGVTKSEPPLPHMSVQQPDGKHEHPRTLQTIKIYLPPRTELVPIPKAASYLGPFGTLISSSLPPVVQDRSAPSPRVVHHDRVDIPRGFNCGLCRPATDGSLVYLLVRQKHQDMRIIGIYAFWVFVYDWRARRGFQIRLPEVFSPQSSHFSH
jgi:hypothetical protein